MSLRAARRQRRCRGTMVVSLTGAVRTIRLTRQRALRVAAAPGPFGQCDAADSSAALSMRSWTGVPSRCCRRPDVPMLTPCSCGPMSCISDPSATLRLTWPLRFGAASLSQCVAQLPLVSTLAGLLRCSAAGFVASTWCAADVGLGSPISCSSILQRRARSCGGTTWGIVSSFGHPRRRRLRGGRCGTSILPSVHKGDGWASDALQATMGKMAEMHQEGWAHRRFKCGCLASTSRIRAYFSLRPDCLLRFVSTVCTAGDILERHAESDYPLLVVSLRKRRRRDPRVDCPTGRRAFDDPHLYRSCCTGAR